MAFIFMSKNNVEPKVIQLTVSGLAELKSELEELVEIKLPAIIKRVATARAHGDLSENAEYHNAREDQQLLQTKIDEIQDIIANAEVVENTLSHDKVGMGSTVTVELQGKKNKSFTYHIVGEFEADPKEGRVSIDSPLGKALAGKKKGDKAVVQAPAGEINYTIKKIG
jgi:transcription elongation factor GreA